MAGQAAKAVGREKVATLAQQSEWKKKPVPDPPSLNLSFASLSKDSSGNGAGNKHHGKSAAGADNGEKDEEDEDVVGGMDVDEEGQDDTSAERGRRRAKAA